MFQCEIRKLICRPANPRPSVFRWFSPRIHILRHDTLFTSIKYNGVRQHNEFGYFFPHPAASISRNMKNRYGIKADHWCTPTSPLKLLLPHAAMRKFAWQPLYKSCIRLTYFSGTFISRAPPSVVGRKLPLDLWRWLWCISGLPWVVLLFCFFLAWIQTSFREFPDTIPSFCRPL